jgi:hypothetical protein
MKLDRLRRERYHLLIEWRRSAIPLAVVWSLGAMLSGCATPPPVEPPMPAPVEAAPMPTCPSCDEQTREIARLRQELATRDAEVRDLRSNQRDQAKVLQESTREVTRAKVKLRRLATQADAASYIAEVEVALESLRSSVGTTTTVPMMALARDILESTTAPFAQGQYGVAMDRAAQAEQLIAAVAENQTRAGKRPRVAGEVPLQAAITLKSTVDSNLRREPSAKASIVGVLKENSAVVAHAYKGTWLYVETDGGRSGWVNQAHVGVP